MTLAANLFARLGRVLKRRDASEQTDRFEARLQNLSASRSRQRRQAAGVFKNRQSHQAV